MQSSSHQQSTSRQSVGKRRSSRTSSADSNSAHGLQRRLPIVDIVLDIDHTLVFVDFTTYSHCPSSSSFPPSSSSVKSPTATASEVLFVRNPQYGATAGIPYRLAPWSLEFLRALLAKEKQGRVRLSFYSTGEKWRNDQLVPLLLDNALQGCCLQCLVQQASSTSSTPSSSSSSGEGVGMTIEEEREQSMTTNPTTASNSIVSRESSIRMSGRESGRESVSVGGISSGSMSGSIRESCSVGTSNRSSMLASVVGVMGVAESECESESDCSSKMGDHCPIDNSVVISVHVDNNSVSNSNNDRSGGSDRSNSPTTSNSGSNSGSDGENNIVYSSGSSGILCSNGIKDMSCSNGGINNEELHETPLSSSLPTTTQTQIPTESSAQQQQQPRPTSFRSFFPQSNSTPSLLLLHNIRRLNFFGHSSSDTRKQRNRSIGYAGEFKNSPTSGNHKPALSRSTPSHPSSHGRTTRRHSGCRVGMNHSSRRSPWNLFTRWRYPNRHRILSKEDLDRTGRKDLTRVHHDLSLSNALLVDDKDTISRGQERNLLRIHQGLGSIPPQSPSEESFKVNHNLARALGLILLSLSHYEETVRALEEDVLEEIDSDCIGNSGKANNGWSGDVCNCSGKHGCRVNGNSSCYCNVCSSDSIRQVRSVSSDWTFQDSFEYVMSNHRDSHHCYEVGWEELTKFSTSVMMKND